MALGESIPKPPSENKVRSTAACDSVAVMRLPMSKTALDRLRARMAAAEQVSDDDLEQFAQVASACQAAVGYVRERLAELGYAATPRVKTTGTLVDKLRRQHTRLSQVQDLAGARVVVPDRSAQDRAASQVCEKFELMGYTCKRDDLRDDPSYGYRAIHVIVQVDQIRVEVQVRTELQDTWAQIVEDLADSWGRGIRYGDEPDDPDAPVRAGDLVTTRRGAIGLLGRLSDFIAQIEQGRELLGSTASLLDQLERLLDALRVAVAGGELPPIPQDVRDAMAQVIPTIDPQMLQSLIETWQDMDATQLMRAAQDMYDSVRSQHDELAETSRVAEAQLRDTLQLIASATDERR